ncbi:MAG TPA: FecR domain-containing protein [Bdellovibrionota bacterium]|nr:FecR domain-containing protein [Bdellovibrionota bacterium]
MRKILFVAGLALTSSLASVSALGGNDPAQDGRVVHVEGKVLLSRGKDVTQLHEGDAVRSGDRLTSSSEASAQIVWHGFAAVQLRPRSDVYVNTTQGHPDLRVKTGGMLTYVKPEGTADAGQTKVQRPRFTVRTRTATMGVRGTAFYVSTPEKASDPTYFCPCHGKIHVDYSTKTAKHSEKDFDSKSHDDPRHLSDAAFDPVPKGTEPHHSEEEIQALEKLVE